MVLRYLSDDPSCRCGEGIENVDHFLFKCKLYNAARQTTLSTLPYTLSTQLCLFGNPELGDDENCEILKTVINYILLTDRF